MSAHEAVAKARRQQAGIRERLSPNPDPQKCDDAALEKAIEQRAEEILASGDYEALIQEAASSKLMQRTCRQIVTLKRTSSHEGMIAFLLRKVARQEAEDQLIREVRRG